MMDSVYSLRLISVFLLAGLSDAANVFKFSAYYEDHMVIQKTHPTIWGYSNQVNDVVHIKINNKEVGHSAVQSSPANGHSGVWQVSFTAPIGGYGPYTITAQSSHGTLTLHDVWFGDVWVCSGQSNMEYYVAGLVNATQEYTDAIHYQTVRLFKVAHKFSAVPLDDILTVGTHWSLPNKSSMSSFSAVCWLFGKLMSQHLNYPIGLVETNWGGTIVEAWSSPDALAKCPAHAGKRGANTPSQLWNGMVNPLLKNSIYGAIWYQGESNSFGRYHQYSCQFPAMIADWRQKFNSASNHATDAQFPFGFVQLSAWRNQSTSLGFPGIRWAQTANQGQVPNPRMPNTFMAVGMDLPDFDSPNGSIHPRYKLTIAERLVLSGYAVAYGHNNVNYHGPYPPAYRHITATKHIQIEFYHNTNPIEVRTNNGFDISLLLQLNGKLSCTVGKVRLMALYVASAIFQPFATRSSIHPRYKHTIAERLVLSGYAVAYGHNNVNYHGPYPSAYRHITATKRIQIEFDHNTNPIEVRTNNGFDVCCGNQGHVCADTDHGWKETQIVSHDTTHVYIDISVCNQHGLTSIGGVRYAWRESPCPFKMCAIYGRDNGLPAPPFIHSASM